jgi:hypothetical protein
MDATSAVAATTSKWEQIAYCGKGWYWILEELDQKLLKLDPYYKITQVKEKFGGLRYYFETEVEGVLREIMYDCQAQAYIKASDTCMDCGKGAYRGLEYSDNTVETRYDGWTYTTCQSCAEIRKSSSTKARDSYSSNTNHVDKGGREDGNIEA